MDYRKVIVPYIRNQEIKKKTESFQSKYWDKKLPVDIEKTDKLNIDDFDKIILKSYIASSLSKDFGVSQNAMEIALNEYEF